MSITFKANINIPQRLKAKTDQFKENFGEAMRERMTAIKARISKGEGPNGKLAPYSASYKKFKAEYGSGGRDVNTVNMRLSGNMMDSMITEVVKTADGAVGLIKFGGSEVNKAKWNQDKRPFFGLNEDDIKRIKIRTFQK